MQQLSKTVSKYTVVTQVQGKKQEIVTLYNSEVEEVKPVVVKEVKEVIQTFTKESKTETGQTVISSNNIVELK